MRKIFRENKIDAVINFAGFKAVGESVEKPLMYYENNLFGMVTLLEVMKEFNVKISYLVRQLLFMVFLKSSFCGN